MLPTRVLCFVCTYRVNTGFFVVHTTPLARDFIERAWAINDCGRGESDQRSMNFVLGRVNSDDESCSAEGAAAEWASLLARHGGAKFAADKFKFYDKVRRVAGCSQSVSQSVSQSIILFISDDEAILAGCEVTQTAR